jgi:hypothetical protein
LYFFDLFLSLLALFFSNRFFSSLFLASGVIPVSTVAFGLLGFGFAPPILGKVEVDLKAAILNQPNPEQLTFEVSIFVLCIY